METVSSFYPFLLFFIIKKWSFASLKNTVLLNLECVLECVFVCDAYFGWMFGVWGWYIQLVWLIWSGLYSGHVLGMWVGIRELKWTGMGEINSDDHYIYYCGQESLRRNGAAITVNKSLNGVLGCNLKNNRMICVHLQGKHFNIK